MQNILRRYSRTQFLCFSLNYIFSGISSIKLRRMYTLVIRLCISLRQHNKTAFSFDLSVYLPWSFSPHKSKHIRTAASCFFSPPHHIISIIYMQILMLTAKELHSLIMQMLICKFMIYKGYLVNYSKKKDNRMTLFQEHNLPSPSAHTCMYTLWCNLFLSSTYLYLLPGSFLLLCSIKLFRGGY